MLVVADYSEHEAILMFKPDAGEVNIPLPDRLSSVHEIGRAFLLAAGIEVTAEVQKLLRRDEVFRIYEKVLRPNPDDDAIWGTAWKDELMDHLTSGPVNALLVQHPEVGRAELQARTVKNFLRTYFGKDKVIRNIAHVPDTDELQVTKQILFGDYE